IDGVTVTDNRLSFVSNHPSLDAIQEVRVQSGNYSAEYGDSAGANVSIHLKSGTNTLHGSAFEFLRNNQLDARGYFRPPTLPKDRLRRHNFGATVTGPILRDKIFFLAAYENQRFQVETPGTNVVMTPAMRRGDFSATGRITDPFAAGAP